MERLKKVLNCMLLNKEVVATYFFEVVKDTDGYIKTRKVEFFNCEGKKECEDKYHVLDCACFREMKRVEHDINAGLK